MKTIRRYFPYSPSRAVTHYTNIHSTGKAFTAVRHEFGNPVSQGRVISLDAIVWC